MNDGDDSFAIFMLGVVIATAVAIIIPDAFTPRQMDISERACGLFGGVDHLSTRGRLSITIRVTCKDGTVVKINNARGQK